MDYRVDVQAFEINDIAGEPFKNWLNGYSLRFVAILREADLLMVHGMLII